MEGFTGYELIKESQLSGFFIFAFETMIISMIILVFIYCIMYKKIIFSVIAIIWLLILSGIFIKDWSQSLFMYNYTILDLKEIKGVNHKIENSTAVIIKKRDDYIKVRIRRVYK